MIRYLTGDATDPQCSVGSRAIIAHICNDRGAWGAGFVVALSRVWPGAESLYRECTDKEDLRLGTVQSSFGCNTIQIANMIAQDGFPTPDKRCAVDFSALEECLGIVCKEALRWKAGVHMPRIGCGIAGATWDQIEPIIERTLCAHGVDVTVYDLPVQP